MENLGEWLLLSWSPTTGVTLLESIAKASKFAVDPNDGGAGKLGTDHRCLDQ